MAGAVGPLVTTGLPGTFVGGGQQVVAGNQPVVLGGNNPTTFATGVDAGTAQGGGWLGDAVSGAVSNIGAALDKVQDVIMKKINAKGGKIDQGELTALNLQAQNYNTIMTILKSVEDNKHQAKQAWAR